jgi:uncharacterized membrane protein YgdD (TMEM256/DUF423 family)
MKAKTCLFLAGIAGASAVTAGAITAHLSGGGAALDFAVRYHTYHALALLALAACAAQGLVPRRMLDVAAWCFVAGIVLFSGGIYLQQASGIASLGAAVPLGGLSFIAGWLALALGALRPGP